MINVLYVTYKCNWHCTFCLTNTHNQKDVDFQNIIDQINKIKKDTKVTLSGGEPGLLSHKNLEIIFKMLEYKNCNIHVNTNGEIFKHKDLLHYIHTVSYHCSENLDNYVSLVDFMYITYIIVVSNTNKCNLDNFLYINKHIKFLVIGADNRDILNKIDGIRIWLKYQDIIDIDSKHKLLFHHKYKTINKQKEDTKCESTV